MARPKAPCGTEAAYRRHLRAGEPVDEACRVAHNERRRATRQSSSGRSSDDAVEAPSVPEFEPSSPEAGDDLELIVSTLREAFKHVASNAPSKVAPLAREFRAAVEASKRTVEPPKEMTLAEQLAEARAARAARAQGQDAPA